jgi:hypothetical protein
VAGSVVAVSVSFLVVDVVQRACSARGGGEAPGGQGCGGNRGGLETPIRGARCRFGLGLALWEAICGPASGRSDRWVPRIGVLGGGPGRVELFELGGGQIADVAVQALSVVPVHPPERRELDLLDCLPRAGAGGAADQLGLVIPVDCFGQSIVIAVADRSDRRVAPISASRSP